MTIRQAATLLAQTLALIVAPILLYAVAVLAGGLIPANAGWSETRDGVTIFIRTNGVHTWVVVPTVTADMDWRPLTPASDIRDPRYAGHYVAIGFGNREFYLNTPTWGDLSPRTAAAAAFGGGPSLMHVDHVWGLKAGEYDRPLRLDRAQYRRLTEFLLASFTRKDGRFVPLIGRGYGASDVFYESRRPYNFVRTCNEWTGEALRAAGVRTGVWTPLAQSIMWRLD